MDVQSPRVQLAVAAVSSLLVSLGLVFAALNWELAGLWWSLFAVLVASFAVTARELLREAEAPQSPEAPGATLGIRDVEVTEHD